MENQQEIKELFGRYVSKQCSPEEAKRLLIYLESGKDKTFVEELIAAYISSPEDKVLERNPEIGALLYDAHRNIKQRILLTKAAPIVPLYRRQVFRAWIAAAIIITSGLIWSIYSQQKPRPQVLVSRDGGDIAPGSNRATLTLEDGSVIELDSATNGMIARQNGVLVSKTDDGQIIYEAKASGQTAEVTYNTISTPNGGQYKIVLPDGSRVWLNAASSLQYPTAFIGEERRVTLTGEGYFEVAKQKGKSFLVENTKQTVTVLGTHFNINAYNDEPTVNTTLLEGSVNVTPAGAKDISPLKPGQQSQLRNGVLSVTSIEVEDAVAWKNGMFHFQDTNLGEVMRQLERWYDVDVDYTGMPDVEFVGVVPRNAKLSSVLKALELTSNVKFKVEERRIRLMK